MKVLVTGGTGFIGSHYAEKFAALGHDVTVFDKRPQLHEFRTRYVQGDIMDRQSVRDAVRSCDLVVHAAGILGTHETCFAGVDTSQTNIIGGLNILEEVTRHGNLLLNISKPNVWLNPYSITKDCLEKFCFMYVREFGAKIAILKLYNVYGSRQKYSKVQKAVPSWIVNALVGNPIEVFGTGTATMDLVHVQDVCDGTAAVIDNFEACRIHATDEVATDVHQRFPSYNGQVLELGSGVEITVNDAIQVLARILGVELDVKHLPMRRGEIDGTRLCADIKRLSRLTGYRPRVSPSEGLLETIEFYKGNLEAIRAGEL